MSTVRQLLAECSDLDRLDAEVLLAEALGRDRAWLFARPENRPEPDQLARFREWVERRRRGEPVAYLTGWRDFWSFRLRVSPATLIPRPETELLVEQALTRLPIAETSTVLDLGTGTGAIALAIAADRPRAQVTATDNCEQALAIANENAASLKLSNVGFLAGSWYECLPGRQFDLIVSNPPYIASADPHLESDVRYEPRSALTPGGDGLGACAAIIAGAKSHLNPGGFLLLEHGFDQRDALVRMLEPAGLHLEQVCNDLSDLPRVLIAAPD